MITFCVCFQYLGFGMPASSSEGRRAAQASASPMDNDQVERDANLRKVQAKDLVEFGMIPVSILSFKVNESNSTSISLLRRNSSVASRCSFRSTAWTWKCWFAS